MITLNGERIDNLPSERRDRLRRHALRHESHAGAAADAHVEAVGRQRLLQLGIAGGVRGFYLQAVLGEDAGLDTDVQRGERPSEGHRLANAELFRGICWRGQEHDKQAKERTGKFGHGILP